MVIPFTSMHGLGNDYVLIDADAVRDFDRVDVAQAACARHPGIGADGLLLLSDDGDGPVGFAIINADGSEAELCGNGLRCAAALISSRRDDVTAVVIESAVGRHAAEVERIDDTAWDVGVTLVEARVDDAVSIGSTDVHRVQVGNPHLVVFAEGSPDPDRLEQLAQDLHDAGHEGNVHLAGIRGTHDLWALSWERGVGATLACATGAAATLAAAHAAGMSADAATLRLPGGDLEVDLRGGGAVHTRGVVHLIATGSWVGP